MTDEQWDILPLDNLSPIEGKPQEKFIKDFSKLSKVTMFSSVKIQKQQINAIDKTLSALNMHSYYIEHLEKQIDKLFYDEEQKFLEKIKKIKQKMAQKRAKVAAKIYGKNKKHLDTLIKACKGDD